METSAGKTNYRNLSQVSLVAYRDASKQTSSSVTAAIKKEELLHCISLIRQHLHFSVLLHVRPQCRESVHLPSLMQHHREIFIQLQSSHQALVTPLLIRGLK